MTAPRDPNRAYTQLKTTDATNRAVRSLAARATAELGGARVTHDRLIYALTEVVDFKALTEYLSEHRG